jgi:hypothetical protein
MSTLMAALVPVPSAADTVETESLFEIRYRGVVVAELAGTLRESEAAYAASATLRTTGLARAFQRVRMTLQVEGFRDGTRLTPYRSRGTLDTGARAAAEALLWPRGQAPQHLSGPPDSDPGVAPVAPRDAVGAVDSLTAMLRLVRPQQAPETLCGWELLVYDGMRLSSLGLGAARIEDGHIRCEGAFVRRAGYPEAELRDAARFPLSAVFTRRPDGLWELTDLQAASIYGPVRIVRRD